MYEMGEDTLGDQLIMRITDPLLTSTQAFSNSSFVINFI